MNKIFLATTSLLLLASAASAADLATKKAPPAPSPAPLWTGFYAGLNLGGGWGASGGNSNVWNSSPVTGGNNAVINFTAPNNINGGVIGGGQIGYNHQLSSMFVVGAEADFQGTTMGSGSSNNQYALLATVYRNQGALVVGPAGGSKTIPWFGTVRGRIGITPIPSLFIYRTGGFAYA